MKFLQILPLLIVVVLWGCTTRPDIEWKFKTGDDITHSPAIAGNKLIVSSNDRNLYALDLKDGKVLWKTDLGDRILMSPLVDGDHIYVGAASGYFYQIRVADGSPGWKFKAEGVLEFDSCADSEGIYFGSYGGYFYKLNRQGELLWSLFTPHQMTSSCTFYKDLVITTSWDQHVYGIRRDTGKPVWKVLTGQFNYGNGIVVGDSVYYSTHGKFYRIDAATGKVLYVKDGAYNDHMVAIRNFIFTQENGLTKRSLDGKVVHNLPFLNVPEFEPAVVRDYIVTADTTNHLYGISQDMKILWKFRAKHQFWAPGVLQDGIYYIGNLDTYVYALRLPA